MIGELVIKLEKDVFQKIPKPFTCVNDSNREARITITPEGADAPIYPDIKGSPLLPNSVRQSDNSLAVDYWVIGSGELIVEVEA